MLLEVVVLADLLERDAHVGQRRLGVEGGELLDGERAGGAEQRGFKQLGERSHGRSPSARTAAGCTSRRVPRLASSSSASRVDSTSTIVGRGPSASSQPNSLALLEQLLDPAGGALDVERPGDDAVQHRRRESPAITRSTACSSSSRSSVSGGGGSSGGGGR